MTAVLKDSLNFIAGFATMATNIFRQKMLLSKRIEFKQDRQGTHNVTLRRVRETIVAVEKR
jgi:hypothetical protein